ncbi:hypothetical protein QBC41DRAFT_54628 [Cercophora samala]|uniref:Uncharacterized protein n=1 Tax=Cercophora samala TaxID=330535 RepID=A0AA39ZI81_9PEZI|nr:hypothetical protein QBC41DRAFT_54628 [Cercophora samala]
MAKTNHGDLAFLHTYQTAAHLEQFIGKLLPFGKEDEYSHPPTHDWGSCWDSFPDVHEKTRDNDKHWQACRIICCSIERLIRLTCAVARKDYRFYRLPPGFGVWAIWCKTVLRIVARQDPAASNYLAVMEKHPSIGEPWEIPGLDGPIRSQFKDPNARGREPQSYMRTRVGFVKSAIRVTGERVESRLHCMSSLSEMVNLLQALHRHARDGMVRPLGEMELSKEELQHVKHQMMVWSNMPESKARMILEPEMERTRRLDSEWKESEAYRDSQDACDWLQRQVIKPLQQSIKKWRRAIRGYENDILVLQVWEDELLKMGKALIWAEATNTPGEEDCLSEGYFFPSEQALFQE